MHGVGLGQIYCMKNYITITDQTRYIFNFPYLLIYQYIQLFTNELLTLRDYNIDCSTALEKISVTLYKKRTKTLTKTTRDDEAER